jgi:sugar phosphate isomerase/epimerase
METRRSFIKTSTTLTAGGLLSPCLTGASLNQADKHSIGIQLFTVGNFIGEDTREFLKKLADIGFKEIESAGGGGGMYYGYKPAEFKKVIEGLGMKWIAHHSMGGEMKFPPDFKMTDQIKAYMKGMRTLQMDHKVILEDAVEGGWEYLVCASTPIATVDEINTSIETFAIVGEDCQKAGVQFAYHNHATEFDPVEGKTPYERILSQTDKNQVKMELDMAWVLKGGKDPLELFNEHQGRFPLWHMKDYDLKKNAIVALGDGEVDFKRILTGAKLAGMKHMFYEQDTAKSLNDVSKSFNNLFEVL